MIDPAVQAAANAAASQALADADERRAAQAMVPTTDEDDGDASEPEDEPEAPPMFEAGQRVAHSGGKYAAGVIVSILDRCPDYEVEGDDGEVYVMTESQLTPEKEDDMSDTTARVAHVAIQSALGLEKATVADCVAAIEQNKADLVTAAAEVDEAKAIAKAADNQARDAAFKAEGLLDDDKAREVAAATITREDGLGWDKAVSAHKAAYPFLYEMNATAEVNTQPGEASGTVGPDVTPVTNTRAPLPEQASAPARESASVLPAAASWRDRIPGRQ